MFQLDGHMATDDSESGPKTALTLEHLAYLRLDALIVQDFERRNIVHNVFTIVGFFGYHVTNQSQMRQTGQRRKRLNILEVGYVILGQNEHLQLGKP